MTSNHHLSVAVTGLWIIDENFCVARKVLYWCYVVKHASRKWSCAPLAGNERSVNNGSRRQLLLQCFPKPVTHCCNSFHGHVAFIKRWKGACNSSYETMSCNHSAGQSRWFSMLNYDGQLRWLDEYSVSPHWALCAVDKPSTVEFAAHNRIKLYRKWEKENPSPLFISDRYLVTSIYMLSLTIALKGCTFCHRENHGEQQGGETQLLDICNNARIGVLHTGLTRIFRYVDNIQLELALLERWNIPCVSDCISLASSKGSTELSRAEIIVASKPQRAPKHCSSSSRRDTLVSWKYCTMSC